MANSFQEEQDPPEVETLASLAENLVYRLPGCDDLTVRKALRDVYREFCRETKCLTAERRVELEAGRRDYPLPPAFGGVVERVRSADVGGRPLAEGVDFEARGARPLVVVLSPRWVDFADEAVPAGEEAAHRAQRVLRVVQEEIPSIGSERAPRWLVELHGEAVCSGVMARLCSMTGRAWSDAAVAAMELARYENAKSEERMRRETPPGGRFLDMSRVL